MSTAQLMDLLRFEISYHCFVLQLILLEFIVEQDMIEMVRKLKQKIKPISHKQRECE